MSVAALVAFSGVFALGVIFSILGSVKLKLAEALGIDDAKVGTLISALMFSSLIAVLIVGPLTDMLGYRIIAIVGFALGGICVWLLASALSYRSALIACLLLGIAAMCVNTVGNVLGPTVLFDGQDPARASNLLNVFFGLGAFLTPLILATLLGAMGYKKTVGLIGTVLFIPIIYSLFAELPDPPEGFVITQAFSLLGNPAVLLGGLALFCYIALESSMAGFVTTYLKSHEFSDEKAGTLLSGFWICLMLARLVAAITLTGIDPAVVVPVLAVTAAIAIGVMVTAQSPVMGAAGTLLAGFALGPIFPTLIGVTYMKAGTTSGSVFGLIFAIGLFGGIIVPTLIGKYAAQMNIRQSLKIALGVAIALVVVSGAFYVLPPVQAEIPDDAVSEIPMPVSLVEEQVLVTPTEPAVMEAVPVGDIEIEEAVDAADALVEETAESASDVSAEVAEEAADLADAVGELVEDVVDTSADLAEEIIESVDAAGDDATTRTAEE